MKHQKKLLQTCATMVAVLATSMLLFSFALHTATADFFKQLGISKTDADTKIVNSILAGSFDQYGLRNAKNIALGNRAGVMKDVMVYAKSYISSPAFLKGYKELREQRKPEMRTMKTPEEMQKEMIAQHKKSVADMEASAQKADASMKPMFEKMVLDAKKQLKESEDPNNKMMVNYKRNYAQGLKDVEKTNAKLLAEWETQYPVNHLLFVKMRMQQFLDETKDIDFGAELFEKKGKKYFVNKAYESKSNNWKMAFRAGKEVVEPTRIFVQQWMDEIK